MLAFLIVSIFMMSTFVFAADGDGATGKLAKKVVSERNFRGYYQGPGTLFLSKEWRTVDGDEIEDITEPVTFRIYDSSGVEVAVVNLPNTAGQYSTNLALDPGEGYTILEDPIDGYMPMYPDDNNSFNIVSEQTTPMVVSNMPVGYLHLQKQWFDATGNDITEDMNDVAVFKLYREGVEFIEIELTPDGQVGETYMTDLVLPVGNYRIEEEYIPGFITEYEVYSYDATSPTQSDEFEIVQGMETVVFPKNTVDTPTTANLTVRKFWGMGETSEDSTIPVRVGVFDLEVLEDGNIDNDVPVATFILEPSDDPSMYYTRTLTLPINKTYVVKELPPFPYAPNYLDPTDPYEVYEGG